MGQVGGVKRRGTYEPLPQPLRFASGRGAFRRTRRAVSLHLTRLRTHMEGWRKSVYSYAGSGTASAKVSSGSTSVNVLPISGALSISTRPPCSLTMPRTIGSPAPTP
jgi:hypothetical protein